MLLEGSTMKKYAEDIYKQVLLSSDSDEDIIKVHFTFFSITRHLHDEMEKLINAKACQHQESLSEIIAMPLGEYIELKDTALAKIKQYGIDTHTKVERIDDMKVIYFFTQALIAKYQNKTAPHDLKLISKIAYEYIKKQAYSLKDNLEKSIMLDKIDYLYGKDTVSFKTLWDLYGKYGIYSVVKSVYYMYYNIKYPEDKSSNKTKRDEDIAYNTLISYYDLINDKDGRELVPTVEHCMYIISHVNGLSDDKYKIIDQYFAQNKSIKIDLRNADEIKSVLSDYEGNRQ